jgi:putative sigma-54 modulation protein
MDIQISGRGVDLAPGLRRRMEAKLAKVGRLVPKATEARVVLGLERHRHLAEVTLQAKRATLHAEGAGSDIQSAVDLAVEALLRQARRRHDRVRGRKPRAARRPRPAPSREEPPAEPPDVVVRRLAAKPMSVDEALEQMRARPDGVLVFTNARSRTVNVLHRDSDGQLILVQPTA